MAITLMPPIGRYSTSLPPCQGKLAEQSIEVAGSTSEQFGALIRTEYAKWGELIKGARLNVEQ